MRERAESWLRRMLGPHAQFRDGQWEAIEVIAKDRQRALVVERTGWGKSLVYFIATRLLRDAGSGPTLLISPLLALMRNQIEMAERIGIRATTMNSDNRAEWEGVESALAADACDVLMVSPERLGSEPFVTEVLPKIRRGIGLLVVDEAHCISDWGHDFRPDYRRVVRIISNLPRTVPVLATTATANDRVVADVEEQLGPALITRRGPLTRPSLRLQVLRLDSQSERLAWLAEQLPRLPGAGIVYCLTVGDCERVSEWLAREGIDAPAYHARLPVDVKGALERRLLRNDLKALVATVALGMGFDKPDLGFVVHYQRPGSVVAYYQQIGRAGRAVDEAHAILLNGREDDEIQDYFIRTAFPGAEAMDAVLAATEAADGITPGAIEARVNLSRGRIEQCLKLLEIDGAVTREGDRYLRTVNPWTPDEERWERVTRLRRHELQRMQTFVALDRCLMEFVARELDDPTARACGRCAACVGATAPATWSAATLQRAVTFLKRDARPIAPRNRWPLGKPLGHNGRLLNPRNAEGRALCIYGDAGWGEAVHNGKYRDGRFGDELVHASADMVRERWAPAPAPAWVTAVPSLRHPRLVADFARRLAAALGLRFRPVLAKGHETPEQKTMQNSSHQLANLLYAFQVTEDLPPGPVLLVDDIVDSRWTFTICGALLRDAGCETVYPFALATAAGATRLP